MEVAFDRLALAESRKGPAERCYTMPAGVPELTLGWGCLAWITDNIILPDADTPGAPFTLTESQIRFLLHFYAVNPDGSWVWTRGVRRLSKGAGKSPYAAALALLELLGPVRVADMDPRLPGGVLGKPVTMPWIQLAATSEKQVENTMRMCRAMAGPNTKLRSLYDLRVGKTFIDTPDGGKLEQITSSATTAEGAQLTFAVCDEVEHWTPTNGGVDLSKTIMRNAGKRDARILETCNAWTPGSQSVAEASWNAWCLQEEGKTREKSRLYDAIIAPANTALTDEPGEGEISLTEGLKIAYAGTPWVNIDRIKSEIWDPANPESVSRRFYLNQPNAAENAWVALRHWTQLADPERELVDGEDVVLFFDGSKSNDYTALVGCCMSDGHVFTVGIWRPGEVSGVIDVEAVNAGVERAFGRFNVVAFWADVREWESYTKTMWPDRWKDQLLVWAVPHGREAAPVAWDMRSHAYQFAEAAETCLSEILDRRFTHDGDWETGVHISNCRVSEFRGRFTVKKESPKSPKKIDAAVCVIGARMVYRFVKASPQWEKHQRRGGWSVVV